MPAPVRYALCNELFQNIPFAEACAAVHEIGYTGIEIAPFTLAENPSNLTAEDRASIRQTILQNQLTFVGVHWILAAPANLHATTSNTIQREQTWRFIRDLIDLTADLRTNNHDQPVLVFGSPKQRTTTNGTTPAEAVERMHEGLAQLAPHAEARGVAVLLEPLSPDQCNVVNTLDEAVTIVNQIASPAIQTMFDVHNAVRESMPHRALIERYWPHIRHIHVNEMDGREPGTGNYDFGELLSTLTKLQYTGWVSLEAFDFSRDPRTVAAAALRHLESSSRAAQPIL